MDAFPLWVEGLGVLGGFFGLFLQPQEICAHIKGKWCPLLVTPKIICPFLPSLVYS